MLNKIKELIIFEDKDILVCRKPAGLAVQNARIGSMDLESSLKNYLAEKDGKRPPYLAVVHRLDQPVEGVLVFGKNPKAARELSSQISSGKMQKLYLAVTYGKPPAENGELEDYLKKDGKTNMSCAVKRDTPGSKKARLSYRVLEKTIDKISGKEKYLLQIHLETGRHHQIRVQMAHAGMPLAGDRKYGTDTGIFAGTGGLALCAASLTFYHPFTKKEQTYETLPQSPAFDGFCTDKKIFAIRSTTCS